MRRPAPLLLLALALGAACTRPGASTPPGPADHVIMVSVDGLMPEVYLRPDELGLAVPTLRALKAAGAHSPGVRGVFPTVTYPTHTTLVTGADPGRHGIVANAPLDPLQTNADGWYWYAQDIRAPTLWDVAEAAGRPTAAVFWPVSVGARVSWLVPEYWRARTVDDDKLLAALSTPGLLAAVHARFPAAASEYTPQRRSDAGLTDIAVHLIERERPALLLLHIFDVDGRQHGFGPRSPEALATIEAADAQLARVVAAAKQAGTWERTALVVVSDHGFMPIAQRVKPGVLLHSLGLVELGENDRPRSWRVGMSLSGGQAYLYLNDPKDDAARRAIDEAFAAEAARPGSGVLHVYRHEEIVARGGDPDAALALDATDGFSFAVGYTGPAIEPVPEHYRGTHGYDPERPAMAASLIIVGPGVRPGLEIAGARMIDVAPTVAALLGLTLPAATGRPLALR